MSLSLRSPILFFLPIYGFKFLLQSSPVITFKGKFCPIKGFWNIHITACCAQSHTHTYKHISSQRCSVCSFVRVHTCAYNILFTKLLLYEKGTSPLFKDMFCMALKLHSASWVNNNCQSESLLQYNDVLMKVCNTVFSFIFYPQSQTISMCNNKNK